jgi:hypothetical protein
VVVREDKTEEAAEAVVVVGVILSRLRQAILLLRHQ